MWRAGQQDGDDYWLHNTDVAFSMKAEENDLSPQRLNNKKKAQSYTFRIK